MVVSNTINCIINDINTNVRNLMPQTNFRKTNKMSSNKRNRAKLEYQKFEERKMLTGDFGPIAIEAVSFDVSEIARQPTESLSDQILANEATASLRQGLNGLVEVASETSHGQTTTVLQQTWNGLPVYNSFVTAVQDETGEIISLRDQTLQNISGYADDSDAISADEAIAEATYGLSKPTLLESTAHSAWYYAGNKARLAWVVQTSISNPDGEVVDQYETWVNAFGGGIFNQEIVGNQVSDLIADPVTETGIFPRIVINDAVGPAGSQAFAEQFNSVVSISVGCTGVLISPESVATARHCGVGPGDTISFGQNSNAPTATFSVATAFSPDGPGTLLDGGDFTILTLTESVPASVATPMRFIDATDELVGLQAATVGYGFNGIGSVGHEFTADGFRWGGENIIDAFGSPSGAFGSNIISTDFDDGTAASNTIPTSSVTPLLNEATTAPGDSGSPILVDVNGEWVIAGVLSGGTSPISEFGDISWWTGTSIYRAEIEDAGGTFIEDESTLGFSQNEYFVGDSISVRIIDGNATDDITVTVTSDTGDSETFTAAATSPGEFVFNFESSNSNIVIDDGTLQVTAGDTIVVTYNDIEGADGTPSTLVDSAIVNAVTASELIGVDFDVDDFNSPFSWLVVTGGSDADFSDLDNEQSNDTPIDLTINGTYSGLGVEVNPATIPLHPNSLANVGGQIQTNGEALELIYSDLVASADYLVYVLSAEGVFDSIEQTVSIQGLGNSVVFEQRFNQGDLFINDQVGDNTRNLTEYGQLITADIDGRIVIDITPIDGTQDVVLSGLAIVPYEEGIDAISDVASTSEDVLVNINVTANDIETGGETITLESVSVPGNGTATITSAGTVDYVPAANFAGTDTFTYTISDPSGNLSTGSVTVEVASINDAPTGAVLSPSFIREDIDISTDTVVGVFTGIDVDNSEHTFTLVDGAGDNDNNLFRLDGNTVTLLAGNAVDFNAQPQYSIRVSISDGIETVERAVTIAVVDVASPATVVLADGDDQRSVVTNAVISFDEIVSFGANPFELIKRGPEGGAVTVTPTVDNSSGRSVVTLTFSGAFVNSAGSLEDGNYQLTVFGDQVTGSGGAFDGDNDGVAGGDFVFGDNATDNFFRFFGDSNGDRIVSAVDLFGFRRTWLQDSSDAGYDSQFDYDANGVVSAADLLQFRRNYLDRLDFS